MDIEACFSDTDEEHEWWALVIMGSERMRQNVTNALGVQELTAGSSTRGRWLGAF